MKKPIHISNINFSRVDIDLFHNLSLDIKYNSLNLIFGKSGKGKTTLIDILSGLIKTDNISFDNSSFNPFLDNISYQSQKPFFIDGTVLENILLSREKGVFYNQIAKLTRQLNLVEDTEITIETFLSKKISNNGVEFSGGQLQRIALIRTLISDKEFIFLDEVTVGLDKKNQINLINIVREMSVNKTFVIVSHNELWIDDTSNVIRL